MTADDLNQSLPGIAEAVEEILELKREIQRLELVVKHGDAAIDDLNVQCKFWRQAAEHAVTGWNRLEDEHELLKDTLRALVAEPAAPVLHSEHTDTVIDIGFGPMRLLEDETPCKK